MKVPTPLNDNTRDDRFNRGLERLLVGDPTGIDEIEPDLQDIAIDMVQLANDAGWIGTEPGAQPVSFRQWWRNGRIIMNTIAAVMVIGLVSVLVTVGPRVWDRGGSQYGSGNSSESAVAWGPGVCSRAPRSDAEIAAIVRKSSQQVEPFTHGGVVDDPNFAAMQITRDWNTCLQTGQFDRAMAYESEYFIWLVGQEVFPAGIGSESDRDVAAAIAARHGEIQPLATTDGTNLTIYSGDRLRYESGDMAARFRGGDTWLVPVDENGDWIEWPTVVSLEWDGEQWMIVSATRDGVPHGPYFRDDALSPVSTPQP